MFNRFNYKFPNRLAVVFLAVLFSNAAWASPLVVKNLRMWEAPERTRVVFDLSGQAQYKFGVLGNPHRIYIDLENAQLSKPLPPVNPSGQFIRKMHSGSPWPGTLRIVLTLKSAVDPKIFQLKPNEIYGDRLVVDLYNKGGETAPTEVLKPSPKAQFVVAIDAGHGGEDPGAVGKRKTKEKDITLAVAKDLKRLVDQDPDMRGVLIRRGDYYVALRRRTSIARAEHAEIFISIHADAFPKRSVRGSSVYTLSRKGASSEEARWLSDRENAADLVGGVSLKDKDELLAQVLWDLSMTKTISDSRELGKDILLELARIGPLHSDRVEYAGFAVLKSPDMPSVLVETAYLSNPHEENLLRTASHRQKVAKAIYRGIRRYYQRHHPGAAPAIYVVQRGDTLSEIAQRFQLSVAELKKVNDLNGDVVRIGQKLKLR